MVSVPCFSLLRWYWNPRNTIWVPLACEIVGVAATHASAVWKQQNTLRTHSYVTFLIQLFNITVLLCKTSDRKAGEDRPCNQTVWMYEVKVVLQTTHSGG